MLYIDLETYSELDIKKVSLDRYASHKNTRILMCAYALDEGPVRIWQEGEPMDELLELLERETVVAWNVNFERTLIKHVWRNVVRFAIQWRDAMVDSLYAGLPAGLKDCNRTPFFAKDSQTQKEGRLIKLFCTPNKEGKRNTRDDFPEDWKAFCDYCRDDVFDTRLILQWLLERFDFPQREYDTWVIDQEVNDTGVPIDRFMTLRALDEGERLQAQALEDLKALTGLDNPNSPAQLLAWLQERGYPFASLGKELVLKALKEDPDTETEGALDDD